MLLSTAERRDIRNAAMSALYGIAHHYRCDLEDVVAAIEPRRADAPGAQTVRAAVPAPSSPAGSDAVAIPAFLHPRPSEAGLPEVTASGSHSPETANQTTAACAPVEPAKTQAGDGNGLRLKGNATLAHRGVGARKSDTLASGLGISQREDDASPAPQSPDNENAPDPAQAGEPASPAPNQEPAPPPMGVPASEPTGSDNAGEAIPPVSPATKLTLFQRVSAAHAEHPDWTARQIAALIKRPVASVQTTLAVVRRAAETPSAIPAEPPPARLTPTGWVQPEVTAPVRVSDPIKARVLRLRSMRPTWTAGMIAKDLGLTREMVEAALAGEKEAAR